MLRYFLMEGWSNTTDDFGSVLFKIGKSIGIVGRVFGGLLLLFLPVACLISSGLLLLAGYAGGFAALSFAVAELLARALMLIGNAISSRLQRSP